MVAPDPTRMGWPGWLVGVLVGATERGPPPWLARYAASPAGVPARSPGAASGAPTRSGWAGRLRAGLDWSGGGAGRAGGDVGGLPVRGDRDRAGAAGCSGEVDWLAGRIGGGADREDRGYAPLEANDVSGLPVRGDRDSNWFHADADRLAGRIGGRIDGGDRARAPGGG